MVAVDAHKTQLLTWFESSFEQILSSSNGSQSNFIVCHFHTSIGIDLWIGFTNENDSNDLFE